MGQSNDAIALAIQLRDAGASCEVMCLDNHQPNLEIGQEKARQRGLQTVQFVLGTIHQLQFDGATEADKFDLIVADQQALHGLPDLPHTLQQLQGCLKLLGGMVLSVHGELGRIGVEHVREMMSMITQASDSTTTRLQLLRSLLQTLPPSNWFVRNTVYRNTLDLSNTETLHQLFLAPQPVGDLQIDALFEH